MQAKYEPVINKITFYSSFGLSNICIVRDVQRISWSAK